MTGPPAAPPTRPKRAAQMGRPSPRDAIASIGLICVAFRNSPSGLVNAARKVGPTPAPTRRNDYEAHLGAALLRVRDNRRADTRGSRARRGRQSHTLRIARGHARAFRARVALGRRP